MTEEALTGLCCIGGCVVLLAVLCGAHLHMARIAKRSGIIIPVSALSKTWGSFGYSLLTGGILSAYVAQLLLDHLVFDPNPYVMLGLGNFSMGLALYSLACGSTICLTFPNMKQNVVLLHRCFVLLGGAMAFLELLLASGLFLFSIFEPT
jgi:hypothetical protein